MLRVIRAPFFAAVIIPTLLGAALAWRDGVLQVGYLLLTLVGIVAVNAAVNTANDYFDHLSGNDEANRELTPFSGGSRSIQEGIVSPARMLRLSVVFFLVGISIGLYLTITRGWTVLWLGMIGIFFGVFSEAPPFRLNYVGHGLGELAAGLSCGPLTVLGSYYVQTQRITPEAVWASIPTGLLVAAILYINEFPDYAADKAVGKNTLVVVLGRERAVWGYIALLVATYGVIVGAAIFGLFPLTALLALLTVPLAYRGARGLMRFYANTPALIPTNAITILIHIVIGLLLSLGFVLARLFSVA